MNSLPHILAKDIVVGLLQVTGGDGTPAGSCSLSEFDKFFAASRDCDAEIKVRDEPFLVCMWQGFRHDHVGGNANKGLGDAKVAQLDGGGVWIFVEQRSF